MVPAKQIWLFVPRGNTSPQNIQQSAQLIATPDASAASSAPSYDNPCQHPDWWVRAHPEYVTGPLNHWECASALTTGSSRMSKRSSKHLAMAKTLQKRDVVYNM
jgi:hypothetical protein